MLFVKPTDFVKLVLSADECLYVHMSWPTSQPPPVIWGLVPALYTFPLAMRLYMSIATGLSYDITLAATSVAGFVTDTKHTRANTSVKSHVKHLMLL